MRGLTACCLAIAAAPLAAAPIDELGWLAGCWVGLVLIAMPSAKPSANFRAIRVEPRRVDFPMKPIACPGGAR